MDELTREAEKMITAYEVKTPFALMNWNVEVMAKDVRDLLRLVKDADKVEISVDAKNRVCITYTMRDGQVTKFWTEDLKDDADQ